MSNYLFILLLYSYFSHFYPKCVNQMKLGMSIIKPNSISLSLSKSYILTLHIAIVGVCIVIVSRGVWEFGENFETKPE